MNNNINKITLTYGYYHKNANAEYDLNEKGEAYGVDWEQHRKDSKTISDDILADVGFYSKKNIVISNFTTVVKSDYPDGYTLRANPIYSLSFVLENFCDFGDAEITFTDFFKNLQKDFDVVENGYWIIEIANQKYPSQTAFKDFLCNLAEIVNDLQEHYSNGKVIPQGSAYCFERPYLLGGRSQDMKKHEAFGVTKRYRIAAILVENPKI